MLKGLGNLEDAILSSLFGVISSKREDMENKWKNTEYGRYNTRCFLRVTIEGITCYRLHTVHEIYYW
jgi:hypothetical protein